VVGVFLERERQRGEQAVSAKDVEGAVELMRELDGFSSIATLTGQRWKSDGVGAEGDGVIGSDDALVVQAEAAIEIEAARQTAKVACGLGGRPGKALVVVGAEPGEYGVGVRDGGGLGQTKFADETILASAPDALDAALGLGRVGGDLRDAELLEGASELSGRLFAGELFGERPVRVVALEDAVAIAIEAEGYAVRGDEGVQSAQIADGIFGFELEVRGQDLAGGIVLKTDESEPGTSQS
jgi:hypothetical protein